MSKKDNSGWIGWFARNPVAANLLMLLLLGVGVITALQMRTEGFPASAPRNITVTIDFEGGSPEDVEEGAAIKVEDALNGLAGVKKITSTVMADSAIIVVRAEESYPIGVLKDDVKLRVDAISTFSPQVTKTVITEEQEESHVVNVQLYGETDHATLKEAARRVKDNLLELPGVNKIVMEGVRDYEINVEVQEEKLREYGLTFSEVASALRLSSVNLAGGSLKTVGGTINLQSRQQKYTGFQIENIIVRSSGAGGLLKLKDIAIVRDSFTEQAVLSRFQGKPSICLDVQLLGRASITEASDNVKAAIEEMKGSNWLPQSIELLTWSDEAQMIRGRLALLSKNAMVGMGLVVIMLALFLNIKVAFWVALGIPVSFAGAFIIMGPSFLDYSLNDLTTFAFIIVLGIVVDDAIVIGENIFTHIKRDGNGVETVIRGIKEVSTPATFGVLTTVGAFYPLTTMTGDFGGPFRMIAVVTIVCLLFSLIESKLILPSHLAKLNLEADSVRSKNFIVAKWQQFQDIMEKGLQKVIVNYYKPIISTVVRYRFQSFGVFVAILILACGLVANGIVRTVFFSDWESDLIYVELTMDAGTSAEKTHKVVNSIMDNLTPAADKVKEKYGLNVDPVVYASVVSSEDDKATITVQLIAGTERLFSGTNFLEEWRKLTPPQMHVKKLDFFAGFDDLEDLRLELSSPDNKRLKSAMAELQEAVSQYRGVHDVKTNLDNSSVELVLELTAEADSLGLTSREVMDQLRNSILGFTVQRIQRDGESIKVKVRYPRRERNERSDLEKIRIRTSAGDVVPLMNVARLIHTKKLVQIDRVDGKRILELTARLNKDLVSPTDITNDLNKKVFPQLKKKYPGVKINISGESAEEAKATANLIAGFILSLVIIYTLLAIPLKSYTEPIVIMLVIPFGIIGAIIGHMIIGIPLSLLSFFGLLALSGVVVNDSLVLVSRYRQIRDTGIGYEEAIVQAGMSRFRAIILTSVTTFAGLFPLILEKSEQAQLLIPMAVSLAFGILFATIITLLIIPALLGLRLDIIKYFSASDQRDKNGSTYPLKVHS